MIPAPAGRLPWFGVALTSASALLLELSLTRLFSVVLFYHFAFLAISLALLGLGAGGLFTHLYRTRLATRSLGSIASAASVAHAAAAIGALLVVLHTPVSMHLERNNLLRLTILYAACVAPFFLTGIVLSLAFARTTGRVQALYAADLAGAAAACLALVPLLDAIGAPNAIVVSAFVSALASIAWDRRRAALLRGAAVASACAGLVVVNRDGHYVDIAYAKGVRIDHSRVEFARWNAISRVDVERSGDDRTIVIDADASTALVEANPENWNGSPSYARLMAAPPGVANALRPDGAFAIIGPGGGEDVLRAVGNGSRDVTGIEINPLIATTIMRGRYADASHHLYERPGVRIVVSDGRSFLRGSPQRYDVIQMTLVDTWASTAAGAFALSENNLYTVEAFREYFAHLKPDGMIAITRWEFREPREALRVVSVAMAALRAEGIDDLRDHFLVVASHDLDAGGTAVAVLAKKRAFAPAELLRVRAHLAAFPNLRALYLPGAGLVGTNGGTTSGGPADRLAIPAGTPAGAATFAALITSGDPWGFGRAYAYDVTPVTDDRPFFFFTLHVGQLLDRGLSRGIDWKVNVGVAVLGMVLLISAVAVAAFLVVPLLARAGRPRDVAGLGFFAAVGAGFMLIEIVFVQRFVLFLGHPTYALTVVVFFLLLASGAGSAVSRRWVVSSARVAKVAAAIAIAVTLYALVLPAILASQVALPVVAKVLVSFAVLAPLGFAMGMPFPAAMQMVGARAGAGDTAAEPGSTGATVEWAWAVNAGASVLGSCLAIVLAINVGMTATLLCGAGGYAGAAALARALPRN